MLDDYEPADALKIGTALHRGIEVGTSTAILGTYLLVKKDINSWYFWIVGDIAYCALSFANDDYKYIIIYGTLLICAIYGCVKNHKLYNKKFHETSC